MINPEHLGTEELKELAAEEAANFRLPQEWREGRMHREGLAIDRYGTVDRDDAIALSSNDEGHILHVSIADTGSFIPDALPAVAALAERRMQTTYSDECATVPMLPRTLSERVFSLKPGVKPVITMHIPIDFEATIGEAVITREALRPKTMTYGEFGRAALSPEEGTDTFRQLGTLAAALFDARANDIVRKLDAAEQHELRNASPAERLGMLVVRECMIVANGAVASFLRDHDIPALYRGRHLHKSNSSYTPNPVSNLWVNKDPYTTFTSPLRQFADFVNHANLAAHLQGQEYPYGAERLRYIANRYDRAKMTDDSTHFFFTGAEIQELGPDAFQLLDKIGNNSVTKEDLAAIFFGTLNASNRDKRHLQQCALDYIQANPSTASDVLAVAIERDWVQKDVPLGANGKPLAARYTLTTLSGEVFEGATREKNATPTALTIEVLGKVAGIEMNPVEISEQLRVDSRLQAALKDGNKYLRTLSGKTDMEYENTVISGNGGFVAATRIVLNGTEHRRTGSGQTRKEALQDATAQLIRDLQLTEYAPVTPKAPRSRKK